METAGAGKLPKGMVVVAAFFVLLVVVLIVYCASVASSTSQADDAEALHAIASIDEVAAAVEAGSREYADSQFESLLDLAEVSGIEASELEHAEFGTPFIINQIDDMDKVLVYHYPIVNTGTGEVLCVAALWQTSNGWSYDVSTEYAPELNSIDYSNGSYIFYAHDMSVMVDDGQCAVVFSGMADEELESYAQKSTAEKLDDLSYVIEGAHILDVDNVNTGTPIYFRDTI